MTGAGLRAKESASKSSWLLSSGSAHEKSSTRLLPERVPPSMRTVGPFGVDCASSSSARAGQPPASRSSLLMSSGLKPHLAAEPWSQSGASSTSRTSRRSSVSRQKNNSRGETSRTRPSVDVVYRAPVATFTLQAPKASNTGPTFAGKRSSIAAAQSCRNGRQLGLSRA